MKALAKYWRLVIIIVLLGVAVQTNPGKNDDHFRAFLRNRRTLAMVHRFAESIGLIEVHSYNLYLFTLGREGSYYFLGVFDQWIALPDIYSASSLKELAWPEHRDIDAVLFLFIVMFILWNISPVRMARHCTVSWTNLCAIRVWTHLFAQVTHAEVHHLIVNATFLFSVAPPMHGILGRYHFFLLYFGGGAVAITMSLLIAFRLHRGVTTEHLGASGSLYALLGYMAALHYSNGGILGEVRWLGREWNWAQFAFVQVFVSACAGVDVVAHVVGFLIGWAAADNRLSDLRHGIIKLFCIGDGALSYEWVPVLLFLLALLSVVVVYDRSTRRRTRAQPLRQS